MIDAGRQSFPVSALIGLALAGLFVARRSVAAPVAAADGMPLEAMLIGFSAAHPVWSAVSVGVIVVVTLAMMLQLTVKFGPAASRNYLPGQVLLVGTMGIAAGGEWLAASLVTLLLTLGMRRLVMSFHKGYRFADVFHAGFYLGLLPLLYAPAAVIVLPAAVSAMAIYRRSGRELIVCMVGVLLPVPAAGFIHWAAGTEGGYIYRELWRCVSTAGEAGVLTGPMVATGAILAAITVAGLVWLPRNRKAGRNTPYKLMQHTAVVVVLAAATAVLPGTTAAFAALASVPCAVSVPFAFQGGSSRMSTMLYVLMLAAAAALNLGPLLER